jgi:hypothetical protein
MLIPLETCDIYDSESIFYLQIYHHHSQRNLPVITSAIVQPLSADISNNISIRALKFLEALKVSCKWNDFVQKLLALGL